MRAKPFSCPGCGGYKFSTGDPTEPEWKWVGYCDGGDADPGCGFAWHRETEDRIVFNPKKTVICRGCYPQTNADSCRSNCGPRSGYAKVAGHAPDGKVLGATQPIERDSRGARRQDLLANAACHGYFFHPTIVLQTAPAFHALHAKKTPSNPMSIIAQVAGSGAWLAIESWRI